jgi:hypothetical protein
LTPQQRSEITAQLNDVRVRLHALEIAKRRLERMLAEDRWLDEGEEQPDAQ